MATFQKENKPSWFSIPGEGTMMFDFHINPNFQRGFTMPNNKVTIGELAMPYDIYEQSFNGKMENPLLNHGFTHASHQTNPQWNDNVSNEEAYARRAEGFYLNYANKTKAGGLIGDNDWCDTNDGRNTLKWHTGNLKYRNYQYMFLDYEHQGGDPDSAMTSKMEQMKHDLATVGTVLGVWAQSLCSPMPVVELGAGNTPNGNGYTATGALQWRNMYNTPGLRHNPLISGANIQISNLFMYHKAYYDPRDFYSTIIAHELGKLSRPEVKSVPTIWIETEHVDGHSQQFFEYKIPANPRYPNDRGTAKVYNAYARLQAPASRVYADALWSLTIMDGYYHFNSGRGTTNDPMWSWHETDQTPAYAVHTFRGVNQVIRYPHKYHGFTNYVYLANWQVSQPHIKPILETTATAWTMPQYRVTVKNGVTVGSPVWRTGNEIFPSYGALYREPVIRFKLSADGTEALIIAQNPCNISLETVEIRNVANTWSTTIQLDGGMPSFGKVTL